MGSRFLVLGPLPPPYGGVSIHIIRFLELLDGEGLDSTGYPYTGTTRQGKTGKLIEAVRMVIAIYAKANPRREDTLHVHYGGFGYFLALIPLLRRTKARKVITFHSVRVIQDLEKKPYWLRQQVLSVLNSFDLFVPVRKGIGDDLSKLGLTGPTTIVMPAFLPPADKETVLDRLPPEIASKLVANQKAGRLQACVAAYYLGPGYNKNDLYGIEELVKALELIDESQADEIIIWVLVSNIPETPAQKKAESIIKSIANGFKKIKIEICYGLPLIPVMARCGAFLRPSREDGDSVAIREAMSMGLPILASDVVDRPDLVTVFSMAEPEIFAQALEAFLRKSKPVPLNTTNSILSEERGRFKTFVRQVAGLPDKS